MINDQFALVPKNTKNEMRNDPALNCETLYGMIWSCLEIGEGRGAARYT